MTTTVLILVSLTALQRIFEIRLSRRNLRVLREQTESRGGVMWPGDSQAWFGLMVLGQIALLIAPPLEAHFHPHHVARWQIVVSIALWLGGQSLRLWSQHVLGPSWNARGVVSSTQEIVTRGPYRFLRHPNYLGVVLEMIAIPLSTSAWFSLAILNLLQAPLLLHRMHCEERLLSRHPAYSNIPKRFAKQ